ncbi:hypothetical protein SHKM778_36380 [Streptomyces sp. KM77-8]|uniref:WD40 repeat domain-containing protein n=1 Tax=Streptomyces haneummycinicus TaxID=3074435 RepID=A0AAT9HIP7_9ACTN
MGVAVTADGTLLASAGFDRSVVLWNLGGPVLTAHPFTAVWQARFSPDGKLLATADADHTVRLWEVSGRRLLATLRGHKEAVFSVAFAHDGRILASGDSDGRIQLWDIASRGRLATLTGHKGQVYSSTSPATAAPSPRPEPTVRCACGTWPSARGSRSSPVTGTTRTRSPSAPTAGPWRVPPTI